MRFVALNSFFSILLAMSGVCVAGNPSKHDCVSFAEAAKHVGTTGCVSGTVFQVQEGSSGVTFLNFCKDGPVCPFTVVVFPGDLKKVGDIRELEGRQIEIKGTIQDYNGRAQMVLRHTGQLGESAFVVVPRVPTDYDVERRGRYSAGSYSHPKAKKTKRKRGSATSIEDPEEPQ
jgi:DNA/RNA endonuclease YhcR with UshA esterase domain